MKLLKLEPDERHWAAQRWLRLLDDVPDGDVVLAGMEYAQLGQTRSMEVLIGSIEGLVQGRRQRAYRVRLDLPPISPSEWDEVADSIIEESALAAPLLTGQLPRNIEDVFTNPDAPLFPSSVLQFRPSCGCPEVQDGEWCKHAVCALRVVADRLHEQPLLIFRMRGQNVGDLLERLRRRRAAQGSALGVSPAYAPRINLPAESIPGSLEESVDQFWKGDPAAAARVDTSAQKPEPTHALLRRLGPSTFLEAKFPLVGLLASCYDEIAARVEQSLLGDETSDSIDVSDDLSD